MKKALVLVLFFPLLLSAKKFYDDDPLEKEPTPLHVEDANSRKLNMYYDFFLYTFAHPGEKQPKKKRGQKAEFIPAQAVNTLGEVPDSAWFTNRIGSRPMSVEEVLKGAGDENAPSREGKWRIVGAKTEGVTAGFKILDSTGRMYFMKLDPLSNPEMATTADVMGAAFFYALGYNVPENYLVTFDADQLVVAKGAMLRDKKRPISSRDVTEILLKVPRDAQGRLRAVASYALKGEPLGPFRLHGTRSDDPNDVVPHEHRRDLRGLFVFSAWLGRNDAKSLNALDTLVEENGLKYVKHHLLDFGSTFGSAALGEPTARDGNAYLYEFKPAMLQVLTLGLYVPRWARTKYRKSPSMGLFDYRTFEPEKWKPNYPITAFRNRLPDDTFWAAQKVMAFTDEQIRAIVKLAQFSDPDTEAWLAMCLIERRNKIGKTYFARVLPLHGFRVHGSRLEFDDLEVRYGFVPSRDYTFRWSRFDNLAETHSPLEGATTALLPGEIESAPTGSYFAAEITGEDKAKTVTVYLRKRSGDIQVVGIDRTW